MTRVISRVVNGEDELLNVVSDVTSQFILPKVAEGKRNFPNNLKAYSKFMFDDRIYIELNKCCYHLQTLKIDFKGQLLHFNLECDGKTLSYQISASNKENKDKYDIVRFSETGECVPSNNVFDTLIYHAPKKTRLSEEDEEDMELFSTDELIKMMDETDKLLANIDHSTTPKQSAMEPTAILKLIREQYNLNTRVVLERETLKGAISLTWQGYIDEAFPYPTEFKLLCDTYNLQGEKEYERFLKWGMDKVESVLLLKIKKSVLYFNIKMTTIDGSHTIMTCTQGLPNIVRYYIINSQ
jgi:hypothetical protein